MKNETVFELHDYILDVYLFFMKLLIRFKSGF